MRESLARQGRDAIDWELLTAKSGFTKITERRTGQARARRGGFAGVPGSSRWGVEHQEASGTAQWESGSVCSGPAGWFGHFVLVVGGGAGQGRATGSCDCLCLHPVPCTHVTAWLRPSPHRPSLLLFLLLAPGWAPRGGQAAGCETQASRSLSLCGSPPRAPGSP